MEPVKITDTKEWSSIDIFLFSNGQQYSPPRKYHLRSEELQWWGTTMNYLGRTHYGSGHSSIELYAIDGKKVNGPLDLTNGAAYVAVEPPDSFINTGYADYLLRATRSWEKRLAQKSYNTELSNQDLKNGKDPVAQENIINTNLSENIAEMASLQVNSSNITPLQKTRPAKMYQRLQRKSITSPKQMQKKKSCDTHSSVLKRICGETDKLVPCPRKIPLKKNGCINQRQPAIVPCKLNETTDQDLSSCCKKRASIKVISNPTEGEPSKNLNVRETDSVPRDSQVVEIFKNDESDAISSTNDTGYNAINDISIHPNGGQNNLTKDSAIVRNDFIRRTETVENDMEKSSLNNFKGIANEYKRNSFPNNNNLENETEKGRQENFSINNNNRENKSYESLLDKKSEKQVIDEYVAQMNKGGFLLLKLKVKLKDCKTIFNKDKNNSVWKTFSLSNLPKTEKPSQVDINISFSGEFLKSNEQQSNQDNSLQSLLNKLCLEETYSQVNNKKPRIIILQCACRNYSGTHKCCMCDTVQGKEVDDVAAPMPHKLNETFTSCECNGESLRPSNNENTMKTDIINQSTDTNTDRQSVCKTNGNHVWNLAQMFENNDRAKLNDKNTSNIIKENDNIITKNENQRHSVVLTRLIELPTLERDTDNQTVINNDANSKSVCNKSTQTDWCNLLLEARMHEDDHFTFHLPSLYTLKQLNL